MMGCGDQADCSCNGRIVAPPVRLSRFNGSALDANASSGSDSSSGGGFWSSVTKAATTAAAVAVPVAKTYAAVQSLQKPKSPGGSVVQAPVPVVQPVSILDSFGPQNRQIVMYSALGLGALVLIKLVKS